MEVKTPFGTQCSIGCWNRKVGDEDLWLIIRPNLPNPIQIFSVYAPRPPAVRREPPVSTCHYIVNLYLKICHVRLLCANNMRPLSLGGGGKKGKDPPIPSSNYLLSVNLATKLPRKLPQKSRLTRTNKQSSTVTQPNLLVINLSQWPLSLLKGSQKWPLAVLWAVVLKSVEKQMLLKYISFSNPWKIFIFISFQLIVGYCLQIHSFSSHKMNFFSQSKETFFWRNFWWKMNILSVPLVVRR